MTRKLTTSAASRFITDHGRPCSFRTLQKYRTKGPGDPGERGPRWYRDPANGYCYYAEADLLEWIREREARLVERAPAPQPSSLVAA